MKNILIISATGTLGGEITKLFSQNHFNAVAVTRNSTPGLNIDDTQSIEKKIEAEIFYDAVICVTGHGA